MIYMVNKEIKLIVFDIDGTRISKDDRVLLN